MKETTRKILLALYPIEDKQPFLTRAQLLALLPQLTPAGFNSLLFLLEKKEYLLRQELNQQVVYSLSAYGVSELEEQFPALSAARRQWRGEWSVIMFLKAPSSDQNYRYLRTFLLSHGCFAFKRGVFLYPGEPGDLLLKELRGSYRQSVAVLGSDKWLFGDERIIIGQKIGLQDSLGLYSGISNELERLITIDGSKKEFHDQSKSDFNSIFDRFVQTLAEDSGLMKHYYPQVKGALDLLADLQKLAEI